jgi:Asp-tRNA(Asn)/Glu-tRNA(Gln) amidotransferase A subunit family amidase
MFADYDMLLMPLTPEPAPRGIETSGDPSLLMPWTFLGNPAITLNAGLSPDGLPIGLQFVGAPVADEKLLQDGAWCERVLGTLGLPAIADF